MPIDRQNMLLILLLIALSVAVVGGVLGVYAYTRNPYVVNQVPLYRYTKTSRYDVYFYMKPNNIYDSPIVIAEKNLPIYLNLVDSINMSYIYRVENAKASGSIGITVVLRHPDGWSKKYLEKKVDFEDFVEESIYIDVDEVISVMNKLCGEIGLRLTMFNIIITAHVNHLTSIDSTTRKDYYSHSLILTMDLGRNRITVEGPSSTSEPVEEKKNIYIRQSILGIDVETMRTLSTAIALAGVIATAILATVKAKLIAKDPLKDFESKYQGIIVSVLSEPIDKETKLIHVASPRELVKVARLLEKPITKYIDEDKGKTMYMVIDRDTAYILEVDSELKSYNKHK